MNSSAREATLSQPNEEGMPEEPDSESDTNDSPPQGPRSVSEKRQRENALFKDFVEKQTTSRVAELVRRDAQNERDGGGGGLVNDEDDEEKLSVRELLARQEVANRITTPREYQVELFERARTRNTIAVLDTGSGKTHIAVLLLRHVLDRELADRVAGGRPKVAFFLVNSVALVFQQFSVLECGLDHRVERFCGGMGTDSYAKEQWEGHFERNMVVVCTADILDHCLRHSFIRMEEINLLVFDEAHHAKLGHGFARIMKAYAEEEDVTKRPRIFGMTASPVDAKVNVKEAAKQLEGLLHAEIATASNLSLVQQTVNRPSEHVLQYPPLPAPTETPLCQKLWAKFGKLAFFKHFFRTAKQVTPHLGTWCADLYWTITLAEERTKRLEMKVEDNFLRENKPLREQTLDEAVALLREASEIVKECRLGVPKLDNAHLSGKVLGLYNYISHHFERPSDSRCIVFVQQKHTARLLHELFAHIGGPHFRGSYLVGQSSNDRDMGTTFRQQFKTLSAFRKGDVNCLFATSVAEEGLDIASCNIIIRFDLYTTMIQYIQSRGRARKHNSKFVHMVEAGNHAHHQILREVRQSEQIMTEFCTALPADRLLQGNDDDPDDEVRKKGLGRVYVEPTSGSRLTYWSSLGVLAYFISRLPDPAAAATSPLYIMSSEAGKFICEVILPETCPIASMTGLPYPRKSLAKRSAAFEAVLELRKRALLDERLVPIYTKRLPEMRNALLALDSKSTMKYVMKVKPLLWSKDRGSLPDELFCTVLDVTGGLDRPHSPLLLLTRHPLPQMPSFPLHMNDGRMIWAAIISVKKSFQIDRQELDSLKEFTLRIYNDIFAKTFEGPIADMSYWLAPSNDKLLNGDFEHQTIRDIIDWNLTKLVSNSKEHKWTPGMSTEMLADKFIFDVWDGGRRYYSLAVAPNLKPSDPVPENCATERGKESILDYSISLWKASRARYREELVEGYPVVEATKILLRYNVLAPPDKHEQTPRTRAFLCVEPMKISVLPTRVVTMAYVYPAMIHRIESYLIALEAADTIDVEISPALALEAVTKDSDNTGDHHNEPINFRRGMGNNYERLEFLGDCFLKMATSVSVFVKYPDDNEYDFHVKRMLMLCNQNLFNTAMQLELFQFVRSREFSRRLWYPEGLKLIKGKGSNQKGTTAINHDLSDKTVADICEALIGAAFLEHNKPGRFQSGDWDDAVRAVTNLVNRTDHTMKCYAEYSKAYELPCYQAAEATADVKELAAKVELEAGYKFRYPNLCRSAFTHPSNPQSHSRFGGGIYVPSYQRLEFLGDALLDMVCVTYLFYRYPDKDPQWLTEHKMAMVSNRFLGALCVKLGFHRHLRHNGPQLGPAIQDFKMEIEEAERESNGAKDYWTAVKEAPKSLPDIVEAYVGAVFIDSDFDYAVVQRFFDEHVAHYFEDMSIYDTFANNHPTTRLQKLLGEELGCTDFRIMSRMEEGAYPGQEVKAVSGVMIHCKVIAHGRASSSRYAKLRASVEAVKLIDGLAPYEFRARFGCDCRALVEEDSGKGAELSVTGTIEMAADTAV